MILGAKMHPESIPDWYLSQAWFRSRVLLPKSWIQVLSRKVKTFKTRGGSFKNRLCTCNNLCHNMILFWFRIGSKILLFCNKNWSPKHILEINEFPFVDVALRASSILEKHKFSFCWCCPAGGLDLGKSIFFVFVECPRSVKTLLFGWIWASGVC